MTFRVNFDESVSYLYSLGNEVLAMKLGLENIGRLLKALGNPEEKYSKVQVAGTNGKGSTCAFLEAICLEAGINTGMTTSPHLISVTERVRIDGREISPNEFARLATRVRGASEELVAAGELDTVPTYFEHVTAIALLAFAEAGVELAILETGLGGRFDATTAAGARVVAITPVDLDHQKILGDTLAAIAAEKAAIIRPGVSAVISRQHPEVMEVIRKRCAEAGLTPMLSDDVKISMGPGGSVVTFEVSGDTYPDVALGLAGRHQAENASVAILLARSLREAGFQIADEAIVSGLERARHKGRLEIYEGILFDGAHNISGARALRDYLEESVAAPVTMVFGAMNDKDLTEIAGILFPAASNLILTRPDNPRSFEPSAMREIAARAIGGDHIFETATAGEAIRLARRMAGQEGLVCVTGSLYLIGEVQRLLGRGNS